MKRLAVFVVTALLLSMTAQADSKNHVRIVLDLSKSMRTNDKGSMAKLSTLLLYDLAKPKTGLVPPETFRVIPFDDNWNWQANTPVSTRSILDANSPNFVTDIKALKYDAACTYFYPGLKRAIGDFASFSVDDTHSIILITDGLPDDDCKKSGTKVSEIERSLIERDIVPVLKANNIRLYVLAFGPVFTVSNLDSIKTEEAEKSKVFFNTMLEGGSPFFSKTSENLLGDTAKLFAEAFGYDVDPYDSLPANLTLNKERGTILEVAVVALNPTSNKLNNMTLTPPAGKPLSIHPLGMQRRVADDKYGPSGAAYAAAWIMTPEPQSPYGLTTDFNSGSVVIMRPITAELEIKPKHLTDVMAGQFIPHKLHTANKIGGIVSSNLDFPVLWEDEFGNTSGIPGAVNAIPNGSKDRIIPIKFSDHPKKPEETYKASITAYAYKSGNKLLGVQPVKADLIVHPYLSISPHPQTETASKSLSAGEESCASFKFEIKGHLPKPKGKSGGYIMTATVGINDLNMLEHELKGATMTLDKKPIQFIEHAANPGARGITYIWTEGNELEKDDLLGNHEFCIKLAKTKGADPTKAINLIVNFEFRQSPYDKFKDDRGEGIAKPFIYTIHITPNIIDPDNFLLKLLGLLSLFLLWYLRNRPTLAPDLGFAISRDENAKFESRKLGDSPLMCKVFALAERKPIIIQNGDEPVAWVSALEGELYRLILEPGVLLTEIKPGTLSMSGNGKYASIQVQTVYQLKTAKGNYFIRMEFQ